MKISVLIPAHNEEDNIGKTLSGLERFNVDFCKEKDINLDILVIDDGSSDNTYTKVLDNKVRAIRLEPNRGKGGALREGIKKAQGDIIVFLDADLKESSYEICKLVTPILKNDADVVIAKFKPPKKKGGFGFVKSLSSWGVKFFTGEEFTSSLSGQRAFKRQVIEDIDYIPDGFGLEVGMLIDILKKGYNVIEVETDMYHDATGRDIRGFIHRGKQFFDIFKVLVSKLGVKNAGL